MKTTAVLGIVLLSAGTLVGAPLVGMALAEHENPAGHATTAAASSPPRVLDAAGEAGAAGPAIVNDFVGVLLPLRMANLSPRIEETVLDVPAKVGRAVREGDLIVAFDMKLPRHELTVAQAQFREMRADAIGAAAELAAARSRATRRSATVDVDGKSVALVSGEEAAQSRFDAQSAEAKLASAAARIAEIQGRIEQLKVALEENEMRAPFAGVVAAVNFEPGMTAHVGDVVARVVGGAGLRARIAVPEEASLLLRRAARARLSVGDHVLVASLDQVPPEPEPVTRTFIVEGAIINLDEGCGDGCPSLAGRTARAALEVPDAEIPRP